MTIQQKNKQGIFITGTDTGVGKTLICRYLAAFFQAQGTNIITQKWVQPGFEDGDDITEHQVTLAPEIENIAELEQWRVVYRLRYPASPHLAAAMEGVLIDEAKIISAYNNLQDQFDVVLVEGAGGALVPLRDDLLLADVAAKLPLKLILVVRNTLGAINHTLLTIEALRSRDLPLLGIVFNRTHAGGDEAIFQENKRIIAQISGVPVLGELPFCLSYAQVHRDFQTIGENIMLRLKETDS